MTTGDYSEDLHELAASGTGWFLLLSVIVPSALGILCNRGVGPHLIQVRSYLKLANSAVLLLLNYSNAAVSLPQAVADPDPDFLAVTLTITFLLCAVSFAAGWAISQARKTGLPERVSLMFGLGMNNNGTGLVLASMSLADHPRVLLPIIFYNLVQHLGAGVVDFVMFRRNHKSDRPRLEAGGRG
jgi:BASS family bile acid:Na+ symporter